MYVYVDGSKGGTKRARRTAGATDRLKEEGNEHKGGRAAQVLPAEEERELPLRLTHQPLQLRHRPSAVLQLVGFDESRRLQEHAFDVGLDGFAAACGIRLCGAPQLALPTHQLRYLRIH